MTSPPTATTTQPRRLIGHKRTLTSCIASRDRPGLLATSGEDGRICWFDMRCKDMLSAVDVGKDPISSMTFKPGNEDVIYVSSGNEVKGFDVHMTASEKPLETYSYNKEEINQIAFNSRSSFLAAADDSGEIKIIDIRQKCLYKTLRAGHSSICSSVQFIPWRSWEVTSGGLDSKLVMWDFSKGRPYNILDFGKPDVEDGGNPSQCLNPAFVHAIAVPEINMVDKWGKLCVVARGDGVVDVINMESELAPTKSKCSPKPRVGTQSRSRGGVISIESRTQEQSRKKKLHLDYSLGGHTAAVSCVAFSMFGEQGKYIVSGGNDKSVKVWDWSSHFTAGQTTSTENILRLNINLSRKVNWLCTTSSDSENLVVCDTSKVAKVYSIT